MKIEITVGKPAKKEHVGPRSQFAATIKVEGEPFGDECVGETEIDALTSLCRHLPIDKVVACGGAIKAKKAKAKAKKAKAGGNK